MEYFEEVGDQVDPRHTVVLAVSTTLLAVLFLLLLIGDQVTAAGL